MNYFQVVQVFVRIPGGSDLDRRRHCEVAFPSDAMPKIHFHTVLY